MDVFLPGNCPKTWWSHVETADGAADTVHSCECSDGAPANWREFQAAAPEGLQYHQWGSLRDRLLWVYTVYTVYTIVHGSSGRYLHLLLFISIIPPSLSPEF